MRQSCPEIVGPIPAESIAPRVALAVADAGWFTTEALFRETSSDSVSVLLLSCMDLLVGWRKGIPPWSPACRLRKSEIGVWEQSHVLPSGWMKRYPTIGMRPIARGIRRWWHRLSTIGQASDIQRGLVITYPYYLKLCEQLRPDFTVYYNLDDYGLYWPGRAEEVRALEREAVRKAELTICVSKLRADFLKETVPEAAERIHHLPHGIPKRFLAETPSPRPALPPEDPTLHALPRPWLGYIGSLEDRLDWSLMLRLADENPEASIVVIGRAPEASTEAWNAKCQSFLKRPNVHALGWRPQSSLGAYYQTFDINLIPYLIDHPFNEMCSPTKIMDAMGATRPIVATAIPECRLYPALLHASETTDAFLSVARSILQQGSDDGLAQARFAFAQGNTCRIIGHKILELLETRRRAKKA